VDYNVNHYTKGGIKAAEPNKYSLGIKGVEAILGDKNK
jgi:hypothetical protein